MTKITEFPALSELWGNIATAKNSGMRIYCEERCRFIYFSYAELVALGFIAAEQLRNLGVQPRERVLMCAQNSPEFVLSWIGLMLLGAVPVPMPPSATMTGDSSFTNRVEPLLPHHSHFICQEDDYQRWRNCPSAVGVTYIDILAHMSPLVNNRSNIEPMTASEVRNCLVHLDMLTHNDEAFIQYTSGSTSIPKGIIISVRNILANTHVLHKGIGAKSGRDCYLTWLPVYHDYGLVCNFLNCLFHQVDLVMVPPLYFVRRPLKFLKLVGKYRANFMCMPNFGLEMILKALKMKNLPPNSLELESLRWWSIGAEPININTIEQLQQRLGEQGLQSGVMSPSYGLAEATVGVAISQPGVPYGIHWRDGQRIISNGPLLEGFEAKIVDADATGCGRLLLRGDSVASCAYIDGVLQSICDNEGFVDTKDMASLVDGELFILGRADEMFTLHGANYFPYDIENVVRQQVQIGARRVACFGVRTTAQDETKVVLLYESKNRVADFHREMQAHLRELIITQTGLVVDEIYAVPPRAIPVTTSGKIQRKRAENMYRQGAFADLAIQFDTVA